MIVPLTWTDGQGLTLEKRYIFRRGSYVIGVEQQLTNGGAIAWRGDQYTQLLRRSVEQERSMFNVDSYSFDGPIIYNGDKAEKLKRGDLLEDGPYQFSAEHGWVAAIQHHFLSAIVPDLEAPNIFQVVISGNLMTASAVGAKQTVEPGASHTFTQTLFIGPKLQSQLEEIDKTLKLTVDYGWLTILSQPLFWLLGKAFGVFGNWGVSIIAVTVLIKLLFYKLTESSGRSMAKMRNLQPRIKALQVEPGASHTFTQTLFIGPKLQSQLEEIDKTLKLTVDYGWLTILSQPLFWLLGKAFGVFGNWGVSIIAVTVLIKLLFYKLTESSGRSMAKMRNLQPRIKALQERYKDDRQQLGKAQMELYKVEKVNPAAGCLPILIQMPFFLAFYWALIESVEMRQAPFALWITDLSVRDPFFILPLIMGGAMFFQQKLNPQVGDPMQIKVMQVMPIIFTAMFAFFPAGLVLYWVTNTVLSIAQQWKINKVVEAESKQQKGGKKPDKN